MKNICNKQCLNGVLSAKLTHVGTRTTNGAEPACQPVRIRIELPSDREGSGLPQSSLQSGIDLLSERK